MLAASFYTSVFRLKCISEVFSQSSSVVEHAPEERGVVSSILTSGTDVK